MTEIYIILDVVVIEPYILVYVFPYNSYVRKSVIKIGRSLLKQFLIMNEELDTKMRATNGSFL